jgi:hypothetical protein
MYKTIFIFILSGPAQVAFSEVEWPLRDRFFIQLCQRIIKPKVAPPKPGSLPLEVELR